MTARRKVILAASFALALLLAMTVGTQWVFARYEERALTVPEALLFVMETLTTTGYGEQLPFKSGVTSIWAVVLMVTGFV